MCKICVRLDPNSRVLGPKYYVVYGIWDLQPYYLAAWTLKVILLGVTSGFVELYCPCFGLASWFRVWGPQVFSNSLAVPA